MRRTLLVEFIKRRYRRRRVVNRVAILLLACCVVIGVSTLAAVFGYVLWKGLPAIDLHFFIKPPAPVGELGGGMGNAIVGSLVLLALASMIGIPWGIGVGIFLSEYAEARLAGWVRYATDMLSSVPSIVVGLFVYVILVKPMQGFSAHAGGTALAILMIPTVARSTEELLKLVPVHIREAGLALGIPRWKMTLRIVLRGCVSGISTAVILAAARVAGETAPLLFTALNNRTWPRSLNEPIASLPVQIYTYAIAPFPDWHRQAWAGALILVFFVFAMNVVTRLIFKSEAAGPRD